MSAQDHSRAPVLEALIEFRRRQDEVYGPPGHKQGRGVDPRVLDVVGPDVFASDVLMLNGLDDRRESHGVVKRAERLMADAVHAEHAFFSTCGSSLSVKTAMISVAGPGEKLLVARNAHKSIVSGIMISGLHPVWIPARFDSQRALATPRDRRRSSGACGRIPTPRGCCWSRPSTGAAARTWPARRRYATPTACR